MHLCHVLKVAKRSQSSFTEMHRHDFERSEVLEETPFIFILLDFGLVFFYFWGGFL